MAESDILPFSIPSGEAHTILGMSEPIDEYLKNKKTHILW